MKQAWLLLAPALTAALVACHPPGVTKLGTFTPRLVNGTVRYTPQQIANEAKALGVNYERVHQVVGQPLTGQVAVFERNGLQAHLTVKASPGTATVPPKTSEEIGTFRQNLAQRQKWQEAEYLLAHYGTDDGDVPIDFVNFHWYASDEVSFRSTGPYTDGQALRDVVRSIRDLTGKTPVTNEIGQHGRTTEAVTTYLSVLQDEHVPWVFWFDADGIPAQALHNFDPENYVPGDLRENGKAFARFIAGT